MPWGSMPPGLLGGRALRQGACMAILKMDNVELQPMFPTNCVQLTLLRKISPSHSHSGTQEQNHSSKVRLLSLGRDWVG